MSDVLSQIKAPIVKEMSMFDGIFSQSLAGTDGLLNKVLQHVTSQDGKRMRPILTLLIAKSLYMKEHGELYRGIVKVGNLINNGPEKTPYAKTLHAAASLELLHTASLIHDDVVDESDERRGQPSVNSTYNNKIAVLVGDYILSTSLSQIALTNENSMTSIIAKLGQTLSEGEVRQQQNILSDDFSIEAYYDIISKKTAALFETCCHLGALSVEASDDDIDKACKFGHNVGIIFQIRDDIFDYTDSKEIGKPTGNDMLEGKLTLPVLFVLNDKDNPCPENIVSIAKKVKALSATQEEIQTLISYTKEHGGINFARQAMEEYYKEAVDYVNESIIPDKLKISLNQYLDFVIGRNI